MSQRPENLYGKPWTSPVVAVLVSLVILVGLLVGAAIALYLRGGNLEATSPLAATLVTQAILVIGVIVLLVRQQFNIDAIDGHLQQHVDEANQLGQQGLPAPKVNGASSPPPA